MTFHGIICFPKRICAFILCLTSVAFASAASAQTTTPDALVRQGLEAGKNYPGLANICAIDQPLRVAGSRKSKGKKRSLTDEERARRAKRSYVAPQAVFDNLYFVGNRSVASWVIKTSDGLILLDAMNSNRQAEEVITAGIKSLGMDPHDIRYLIIAHAHGDHYGGQEYIVNEFKPRVVMSDADWTELEKPEPEIFNPKWGLAPTRDISIEDGHVIELGDTKVELYVTPGHTLGTISLIFPVKDGQQTHMAALWGGTGLNFGPNIERLKMYSDSAARFKQLGDAKAVDVFLSNHPTRDNSIERMAKLAERGANAPHPFVDDHATDAFALLRDCSLARVVKIANYQERVKQNSNES
ncbi:MBL fold metallo-hydrolase [Marinomonas posidonica]|uniref:Beta-lactamase domain protein n=1 Tax=Marinomonas posidonica (strain CECT 7376 / NCIMB 14433 / IVIA-Po-181) TaxID=491952 RepID=F6CVK4_MARPP|nr:MBL fold metallo-hydrolase [Marinomonas posidonica]AEF55381.1 beta-lactamase domain protein [Marinomonas posidonica IVIA-Po-181]